MTSKEGLYVPALNLNSCAKVKIGAPSKNNSAITHLRTIVRISFLHRSLFANTHPSENISIASFKDPCLSSPGAKNLSGAT